MINQSPRSSRVGEQIQRELATLISTEAKDPRVRLVTLTGVELSPDMRHARVHFTTLESGEEIDAVMQGLQRSIGFYRARLGQLLRIRVMPQLQFVYDDSVERGARLSKLIDDAVESGIPAIPLPSGGKE
jgi:ribosome-binding factor A